MARLLCIVRCERGATGTSWPWQRRCQL